jgi:hypothetical protein
MFLAAVYGGFFGVGIGLLVIGVLGATGMNDMRQTVVLKNVLSGCLRGVAVAVLIADGKVDWEYGPLMAAGSILGGYIGARLTRWSNPTLMRAIVLAVGFLIAGYYFWKIYGMADFRIGGE